jgi:hypothetical protein
MPSTTNGTSGNDAWRFTSAPSGSFILNGQGGTDSLDFGTTLRAGYTYVKASDGGVHVDSVSGASSALHGVLYNMEILYFNSGKDTLNLATYFNSAPTGTVSITGTPTQGQTLTATNTLADADGMGTVSYQWKAAGVAISGATSSTFVLTQVQVGKAITVTASFTDVLGTAESATSSATAAVATLNNSSGTEQTVNLQAYIWKSHTLLSCVALSAGTHSSTSDSLGAANFAAVTEASLSLTASRAIPTAEATATTAAVNLQDAIAILKMIVGLPVNGTTNGVANALSPYQALAADFNADGEVGLQDAIGVLKLVVGLTAPEPSWHFLNELDTSIAAKANLKPGAAQTSITADLSGTSPVHVGLVAYLSGDVDGSYAGPTGASDLDVTQPNYFVTLVANHPDVLSAAQFGG